jgi:NitT/TauT family transport system permease protein
MNADQALDAQRLPALVPGITVRCLLPTSRAPEVGYVMLEPSMIPAGTSGTVGLLTDWSGQFVIASSAWFPLAILVFGLNEQAILFVVVLGAGPSIANGVIAGIDHVPPAFTRLGRVLGAGPIALYRDIVLPAALPTYVAGLVQGWSFAWRSLMAGELLVIIAETPSLGTTLDFARQMSKVPELIATMIVILLIGMLVDTVFGAISRKIRRDRGLAIDD